MSAPYPARIASFSGYNQISVSLQSWPFGFEYNRPANFCNWIADGGGFAAATFPPLVFNAVGFTNSPYEATYGYYSINVGGNWTNVYLPVNSAASDDAFQRAAIINNTVVYYSPSSGDIATIHFATTPLIQTDGSQTPTVYAHAWPLPGQPQIISALPALLAGSFTRPRLVCWENGLTGNGVTLDDVTGAIADHVLWGGADGYMAGNYSPAIIGTALQDGTNTLLWAGQTAGTSTPYEPIVISASGATGAEVYRRRAVLSNAAHDAIFQLSSDQAAMGPVMVSPAGFVIPISQNYLTPTSFFVISPDFTSYSVVNLIGADAPTQAMLNTWGFTEMVSCGLQIIGAAASRNVNGSFWGFVDHASEASQAFTIANAHVIPPVYPIQVACTDCRPLWLTNHDVEL